MADPMTIFGHSAVEMGTNMAGERIRGHVKFFNDQKGYGFIRRMDGKPDVFVHVKDLQQCGVQTASEEQAVTFEVEVGSRGPRAVNIELG